MAQFFINTVKTMKEKDNVFPKPVMNPALRKYLPAVSWQCKTPRGARAPRIKWYLSLLGKLRDSESGK